MEGEREMIGMQVAGLLHAGGWDEAIMVGIALLIGVGVVFFSGRKRPEDDDEADEGESQPPAEPAPAGAGHDPAGETP
jgi:hypothetical protein